MPQILVVDDDRTIQQVIARTLRLPGLTVLPARTTQEALDILAGHGIDAAIVDIVLGPENGWETLRLIRQSSDVPVAMMSGVCMDDEVRLDAEKLGAQDVLPKPFTTDQLRDCITRLLDKKPRP